MTRWLSRSIGRARAEGRLSTLSRLLTVREKENDIVSFFLFCLFSLSPVSLLSSLLSLSLSPSDFTSFLFSKGTTALLPAVVVTEGSRTQPPPAGKREKERDRERRREKSEQKREGDEEGEKKKQRKDRWKRESFHRSRRKHKENHLLPFLLSLLFP